MSVHCSYTKTNGVFMCRSATVCKLEVLRWVRLLPVLRDHVTIDTAHAGGNYQARHTTIAGPVRCAATTIAALMVVGTPRVSRARNHLKNPARPGRCPLSAREPFGPSGHLIFRAISCQ